jgi:hypothetical protein
MKEQLFSAMALLLVIGTAVDVFFGKEVQHRKLLQGALVVLGFLVLMSMPSCRTGDPDEPDGPDIPYRF